MVPSTIQQSADLQAESSLRQWVVALVIVWLLIMGFMLPTPAHAHGSMEDPVSRVYGCYQEGPENPQSAACKAAVAAGGTQQFYDWTGVNQLAGGDHRAVVPDGELCGAGKATHRGLNLARADWPTQLIAPDANGNYEFKFLATAPHSTAYFDFYVTKDGYDPTKPLAWEDLEPTPFCHITAVDLQAGRYHMTCPLPADKRGKHLIYNIWQRDDSAEAFYTCMDVEFADPNAPSTLTSTPTPTPTPTPLATGTVTPQPSPTATSSLPAGDATCRADYTVTSAWDGGFNADVTITNLMSTAVNGWTLTWSFPGNEQITALWNGAHQQSGSGITVTNEGWNGLLAANGGRASIGFGATVSGTPQTPASFVLNGQICVGGSGQSIPTSTPTASPVNSTPDTTPTATTTPTVTPSPGATTEAGGGNHEVVAYFTQWGIYDRNYHVKNIITSGAADKITTINYAFGNVVNGECIMTTQAGVMDGYADYQRSYSAAESVDGQADQWDQPLRGNFNQLRKLKQRYPDLKLMISLGGWTWSAGFHEAAKTAVARQRLAASCIDLYIKGNLPVADNAGGPGAAADLFDGIDIDWEYPAAPGNGNPHGPEDSHNFTLLLQEFRRQLDAIDPVLRLTVATAAGVDSYSLLELDQIHQSLNYINLMSYDFHGAWEGVTGFHAPLYPSANAPYSHPASTYAVDSAVQGYLAVGVPAQKIVIGLPFYGRGWTGVATTDYGLWQPATAAAPGTYEAGIEDYKVLKQLTYPVYRNEVAGAVWKFNGTTFWSYDDPQSIAQKVGYVEQRGLGGVMIWSLDGDSADGELIQAVHAGWAAVPNQPPTGTLESIYLPLVSR